MTPEFGAYSPSPIERIFRRLSHRLPENYWGRRFASLLLGPAGARRKKPKDVIIFGDQKARLYPYDNICEKRVYATPQLWDQAERDFLASAIKAHKEGVFYFVDVGSNAGLYSLFTRAVAKANRINIKAACIEPDRDMLARLKANIIASQAETELRILPYAASTKRGPLQFSQNRVSRGMGRVDETGNVTVQGAPLAEIIQSETDFPRIDALKMDIEGYEHTVLTSFFETAQSHLWPSLIILETTHEEPQTSARILCERRGYKPVLQTKMNAVLMRNA